jgi:putative salt-induced outer membrane protein
MNLVKENKMKMSFNALWLASALMMSGSVLAEDEKAEDKSPWTSTLELGFIRTSGNTETQTTALKADVVYEVDKWRHTGHAEGYGTESEDDAGNNIVSAERYQLSGKSDYKFNEFDYMFGLVELNKDRFSGFEYENKVSAGYGRKIIKQEDMELDLEIGPGVRFFKIDNGESDDEALLRLAGKYWWQISPSSKFTQDLSVDIGEDITSTESITGIQANINSTLALKFTYTIRNKSEVPVNTERTDTELAMTLVYTY